MPDLVPVRRAVISVSDKADLVPFARALQTYGVEIVSTGGTATALTEAGIDVVGIERVTGFPEMMDGRVKTLHPAVHGALLARRDEPSHVEAMEAHGIVPIDLVCINLYPFEQTIHRPGTSAEEAIEQIDIGGPAMLRSAAKNSEFVTVVTTRSQYDRVINEMRRHAGATSRALRHDLAAAAFARTAEYDTTISAWMSRQRSQPFPSMLRLTYAHASDLRYGENPHQAAAVYADPAATGASIVGARRLGGKPLSYNNINDAAAALALVQDLHASRPDEVVAAIIKHANPCGAAVAETPADAFTRAYAGDPLAAYGGILAISAPLTEAAAKAIVADGTFLEVVIAPAFDDAAVERLAARWPNVRLLAPGGLDQPAPRELEARTVPGGLLVQERDARLAETHAWAHAAGPPPDEALWPDAAFAWHDAKHLKSTAIAIARAGALLGAGAGQVDRVTACRIAVDKAGERLREPSDRAIVAASDAFFPFPDGPARLADAGVTCLVHPGGSKRDDETFALCSERGITCLVTGLRHFRH